MRPRSTQDPRSEVRVLVLGLGLSQSLWAAVTKTPSTGRLKGQALISYRSRGWEFKVKVSADLVSGGTHSCCFSLSSHDRRGEGALWESVL